MAAPRHQESDESPPAGWDAVIERARSRCGGDGNDGIAIFAVAQARQHYARGLRVRIVLRMDDGTPVARLVRP